MQEVSMNKDMKLSEHFTLGELTKTNHKTEDQNIPSRVAIENLRNLCENWLEDLRYSYNTLYKSTVAEPAALDQRSLATRSALPLGLSKNGTQEAPLFINSAYRSPEVNKKAGGSAVQWISMYQALNRPSAMPPSSWISQMAPSAISMSST